MRHPAPSSPAYQDLINTVRRLLQTDPDNAEAKVSLGVALLQNGHPEEALPYLEFACEHSPHSALFLCNLANGLNQVGLYERAVAVAQQAVEQDESDAESWSCWGVACLSLGRPVQAEQHFRKAIGLDQEIPFFYVNLAKALLEQRRAKEAFDVLAEARKFVSESLLLASAQVWPALYSDEVTLEELVQLHQEISQFLRVGAAKAFFNNKNPDRKLRVGFLSPDFRDHSVMRLARPIFEHFDLDEFELYAYHTSSITDDVTSQVQALIPQWREVAHDWGESFAQRITKDKIDILVDLAGWTLGGRLEEFGGGLAPVQISMIGYPFSSACPSMGYRVVDDLTDPPGSEGQLIEKPLRLAPCFAAFSPREADLVAQRAPGPLTFGSFHVLPKITPTTLRLWAEVLKALPESQLLLKAKGLDQPEVADPLVADLAALGVAPERLRLAPLTQTYRDSLALYNQVDVVLDATPYHGTTTTFEAYQMGTPVVSLVGQSHQARVGLSLASAWGHSDWATFTPEEYVRKAVELGKSPPDKGALQREFLGSVLCDGERYAAQVGEAFRTVWADYCAGRR